MAVGHKSAIPAPAAVSRLDHGPLALDKTLFFSEI